MSMSWSLNNWFDTVVQGEFAEDETDVKQFLLINKFISPRALSTLEMADMASSGLPLGRQKTLLSFTAPFRAEFASAAPLHTAAAAPAEGTALWIYRGTITNSKIRKCCRSKVYKLAEKHLGKIRVGSGDGISYDGDYSLNLNITVVFKDERNCEEFQTGMGEIPSQYRRRKPDGSSAVADISVSDYISYAVHMGDLSRIRSDAYAKIDSDASPSADCDTLSDFSSSCVSAVELTEQVKLRLLDNPNSAMLHTQKPEKCHLKSQTHHPSDKSNPNNILYMSRFLHQGFDGINQSDGVPDFALKFQGYNATTIRALVGRGGQEDVYEVTIRVEFTSEDSRVLYTPYFKDSTRVEGSDKIDVKVYVNNHVEFKEFLDHKYATTLEKWASLKGPEGY